MRTYRMRMPAGLYFDVRADSDEAALAEARALVERISDGVGVDDTELIDARVYPNDGEDPEIVDAPHVHDDDCRSNGCPREV